MSKPARKPSANSNGYHNDKNTNTMGTLDSVVNSTATMIQDKEDEEITSPDIDDKSFSYFNIFCFGIAGLPYHLMFSAISVYANKFLLDEVKIPPALTSIVLFVSRAIDAITDPIYGHFLNLSPVTRFGKMKPWIAISMPLSAVVYLLLWYKPDLGTTGLTVWFLVFYSLFFTFITGYRIPHTSMTMYLSKSKRKRELATVCRMACEMTGILLSLVLQGFIVGSTTSKCERLNPPVANLTFETETTDADVLTTQKPKSAFAQFWDAQIYFVAAVIVTVAFFIAQSFLLVGVKENRELHAETRSVAKELKKTNSSGGLKDLKQVLSFKPFLLLACAAVSTTTSAQIVQGYFQLYFEYAYTSADFFTIAIIVLLALSILCVPIWKILMNKIGKRYSYMIGNTLMIPFLIGSFFFKEKFHIYIFFPLAVLASNTLTVSFLLPWSMLPECMDQFYIIYKRKAEAIFYTFFVIGTKITISVYLGLGQYILQVGGYLNNICAIDQPKSVDLVLRLLFAPIPIALLILSTVCVYFYPITEQVVEENAIKLQNLNKDVPTVSGKLENGYQKKVEEINSVEEGIILAAESTFNPMFVDDPHISTKQKTIVNYEIDSGDENFENLEKGKTVLRKGVIVTRF